MANVMLSDSKARKKELYAQSQFFTKDTLLNAITTKYPLQARLLDFFSNHFSVSDHNNKMKLLAPFLEREAIAPNLTGKFAELLIAVLQHPTMLVYLNNESSIGANSKLALRSKGKGLNENLAREILELHTLGVNGGYVQNDIEELAMAISGWSVHRRSRKPSGFYYRPQAHQPGSRTVLKKDYKAGGIEQAEAILRDLAKHPSTAVFMSEKLARHFVSDEPDPALVKSMKDVWLTTEGNIAEVMRMMIDHPASWKSTLAKYKTPREFLISACRLCGLSAKRLMDAPLLTSLEQLGQAPFNAGSPAGFSDQVMDWTGGEALLNRIDWVNQFAGAVKVDAVKLAKQTMPTILSSRTLSFVQRAESQRQALALLLMSPEFQRR